MDKSKSPIFPSEFGPRSASERTCAVILLAHADLPKSAELAAFEQQRCPEQVEIRRIDLTDGPSDAVYYRNAEEVREGIFVALRAMELAVIEQLPEPTESPVRGAKP